MAAETLDPVLPNTVQNRAEHVLRAADEQELKLATAESCTGGLLAALLTDVGGLGHVFDRGFVVYSKDAKCDLLGIAREKVDSCGAVSEPVAVEMAQGALRRSQCEVRRFDAVAGQTIVVGHGLDHVSSVGPVAGQPFFKHAPDDGVQGAALGRQQLAVNDVPGEGMAEAVAVAGRAGRRPAAGGIVLDQPAL